MAPMLTEAVTPPEFPNKEEMETNFAPMIKEHGIKEELVAILDPELIITQSEPMLRENDEEAYEEEVATTYHLSSEGKQENTMAHTIAEAVTVSKVSSKGKLETAFALPTEEATVTPNFLSKEEQGRP